MEISDIWRKENPNTIGTTWSNGVKDEKKRAKTRIDRVLVDNRISNRITETQIIATKVYDHDEMILTLATEIKRKTKPYNKIPTDIIKNVRYQEK